MFFLPWVVFDGQFIYEYEPSLKCTGNVQMVMCVGHVFWKAHVSVSMANIHIYLLQCIHLHNHIVIT